MKKLMIAFMLLLLGITGAYAQQHVVRKAYGDPTTIAVKGNLQTVYYNALGSTDNDQTFAVSQTSYAFYVNNTVDNNNRMVRDDNSSTTVLQSELNTGETFSFYKEYSNYMLALAVWKDVITGIIYFKIDKIIAPGI